MYKYVLNRLFVGVFFFGILGCSSQSEDVAPEHILSFDKMSYVLADIQIIESTVERKVLVKDGYSFTSNEMFQKVLLKHKISRDTFDESFDYYLENPEQLKKIYERVVEIISQQEAEHSAKK